MFWDGAFLFQCGVPQVMHFLEHMASYWSHGAMGDPKFSDTDVNELLHMGSLISRRNLPEAKAWFSRSISGESVLPSWQPLEENNCCPWKLFFGGSLFEMIYRCLWSLFFQSWLSRTGEFHVYKQVLFVGVANGSGIRFKINHRFVNYFTTSRRDPKWRIIPI